MSVFMMVTLIVIAALFFGFLTKIIEARGRNTHVNMEAIKTEMQESFQKELNLLQKRVATLEAIVTDKKYQLKKEIDTLEGD